MKKLIALIAGMSLLGSCSVGASRFVPKQEVKVEPEYTFVETISYHGIKVRYFQGKKGSMYIYHIFDREKGEFEKNIVQFDRMGNVMINGVVSEIDGYNKKFDLKIRPAGYSYPELNSGGNGK